MKLDPRVSADADVRSERRRRQRDRRAMAVKETGGGVKVWTVNFDLEIRGWCEFGRKLRVERRRECERTEREER